MNKLNEDMAFLIYCDVYAEEKLEENCPFTVEQLDDLWSTKFGVFGVDPKKGVMRIDELSPNDEIKSEQEELSTYYDLCDIVVGMLKEHVFDKNEFLEKYPTEKEWNNDMIKDMDKNIDNNFKKDPKKRWVIFRNFAIKQFEKREKQRRYNEVEKLLKENLEKYITGKIGTLDDIINNVKKESQFIMNISYTFDESIWLPMEPETYNDLILFKIQLINELEYLPVKLFISKGINQ